MIYKDLYLRTVKALIRNILLKPKLSIVIPSIVIFSLAYGVAYEYLLKSVNFRIAAPHLEGVSTGLHDEVINESYLEYLEKINNPNLVDYRVTKLSIVSQEKSPRNILTFEDLQIVDKLGSSIQDHLKDLFVLYPSTDLYLNFDSDIKSTLEVKSKVNSYLLHVINSGEYNYLNRIYFDKIYFLNRLVNGAEVINIYVIHDQAHEVYETLNNSTYYSAANGLKINSKQDLDVTFGEFKKLFLDNFQPLSRCCWFLIEWLLFFCFPLIISVCVSFNHKIRSVFGLVTGWLVEVLISSGSALRVKSIFVPCNSFSGLSGSEFLLVICVMLIFSSVNLLKTIDELADDTLVHEETENLHKKLFKFYIGFSYEKHSNISRNNYLIFRRIKEFYNGIMLPKTSKVLLIAEVEIMFNRFLVSSLIKKSFPQQIGNMVAAKFQIIVDIIAIGLFIDHLMQLTYLISIIIIDRKRYDFTDLLNMKALSQNDVFGVDAVDTNDVGKNVFRESFYSPHFLKRHCPAVYDQINSCLIRVHSSMSLASWYFISPVLLFLLFGVTISLVSDFENDFNLRLLLLPQKIEKYVFDPIYYLEYFCIIVFINAMVLLIFKITQTSSAGINNKITDSDFEIEDAKVSFKSIDLQDSVHGHDLDIYKISTNKNCPFLVSLGLDHKILIWSPLTKQENPAPINISTNSIIDQNDEFWPVHHIGISNDGNFVIIINYNNFQVKCFNRKELKYIWSCEIKELERSKILECFFRKRTVPGYLNRRILQNRASTRLRKGSDVSLSSLSSSNTVVNGNFLMPMLSNSLLGSSVEEGDEDTSEEAKNAFDFEKKFSKDDFIIVSDTGQLVLISCIDGKYKTYNIFETIYEDDKKLIAAKKLFTPRVDNRIICEVNNSDIIICTVFNNRWRFKKLKIREGYYNQKFDLMTPQLLSMNPSLSEMYDYASVASLSDKKQSQNTNLNNSTYQINKSTIVSLEFVGMFVRLNNLVAELVDAQTGIVLKEVNVGHMKTLTLRISHLEPTHCKFCGCVSIQTLSLMYEEYDTNTLIVHTFKIDTPRSKNNICLRVERDPREIRCLGFNAVTEHQYWFENIETWELTDINMIIGVRKPENVDHTILKSDSGASGRHLLDLVGNGGLTSIRSRKKKSAQQKKLIGPSEGFIITLSTGEITDYYIPGVTDNTSKDLKIHCSSKFGFKSLVFAIERSLKIVYFGNDKLIENDMYYCDPNILLNISSVDLNLPQMNNELLFINKRRKHRRF